MRIYRYEMDDGGGPWFTRNGSSRGNPITIRFDDDVLYGCTSLEELFNYFREESHKVNLEDCMVKVYEIPDEDIEIISPGQVIFPKTYEPIF